MISCLVCFNTKPPVEAIILDREAFSHTALLVGDGSVPSRKLYHFVRAGPFPFRNHNPAAPSMAGPGVGLSTETRATTEGRPTPPAPGLPCGDGPCPVPEIQGQWAANGQ